ncbi:MAG TPA: hypothetical protein VGB20_01840 [bacterium]
MVRFSEFVKPPREQPPRREETPLPAAAQPSQPPEAAGELAGLFERWLTAAGEVRGRGEAGQAPLIVDAPGLIELVPRQLRGRSEALMTLSRRSATADPMLLHAVNAGLLAACLASRLGHDPLECRLMAAAGLIRVTLPAIPRTATDALLAAATARPDPAPAQTSLAPLLPKPEAYRLPIEHIAALLPGGLAAHGANAEALAWILMTADLYVALVHADGPARPRNPALAVKILVEAAATGGLDRRVVKALVDELTLYPLGSDVILNTNEQAVITRANAQAPLRPDIEITREADGSAVSPPRAMSLIEHPFIYIKDIMPS